MAIDVLLIYLKVEDGREPRTRKRVPPVSNSCVLHNVNSIVLGPNLRYMLAILQ